MKYQIMKKRLFVESIAAVSGLVLGAAVLFFLISTNDEYEADNLSLQTKVTELNNELASLNDKFTKLQKNHDIYEEAKQKSQNEDLATSEELIKKLLKKYGARYGLKKIDLIMSPSKKIANPAYNKKTTFITYNVVTINLEALTDEDIYRMIDAMHHDFSGAVKITSLELVRDSKVTKETMQEIANKGHVRMVSAILKLNWFGIEAIEPAVGAEGKPNAG